MNESKRNELVLTEIEGCKLVAGLSESAFRTALKYKPRDDDLFIATYPKCGTTWTQQIVYLIFHKGQPLENASAFFKCSPYLDMYGVEAGEQMPRPGAIKTHLPFHLTPYSDKTKYLYIARNPKDVVVSFYKHATTDPLFLFQDGSFDYFFEAFINGRMLYNDYFDHTLGWYEQRNKPNVLFLTFEELKKDARNTILRIAKFMGEEWFQILEKDKEILDKVIKYSSVDFMKKVFNSERPPVLSEDPEKKKEYVYPGLAHVRKFIKTHRKVEDESFNLIGKGDVGASKATLSESQIKEMDLKIEQKLKGTYIYDYWKSIKCL